MTHCCSRAAILAFTAVVGSLCPQVRAEKPPSFFIYPVKTDLQRELAPAQANLLVFVDASDVLPDDRPLFNALKLESLRKALRPHKVDDVKLHFTLFFPRVDFDPTQNRNLLRYALMGFGHEVGFPKVSAWVYSNEKLSWSDHVAAFTSKPRRQPWDEPAIARDDVKVYPVRTELSRWLTSDSDCAVVIVPSLAENRGVLPEKIRATAGELVWKLKLPHRKRLTFYLQHVPDEDRQPLMDELSKVATGLGFETSAVTFR